MSSPTATVTAPGTKSMGSNSSLTSCPRDDTDMDEACTSLAPSCSGHTRLNVPYTLTMEPMRPYAPYESMRDACSVLM